MSSTVVQAGKWEIQSSSESAEEVVKALQKPEEKKGPKVILDRGKAPEKDDRDPAAVALGEKGGKAAAKAREERAKEEAKDSPEPEAKIAPEEAKETKAPEKAESEPEPAEGEEKPAPKPRHDLQARVQQLAGERRALAAQNDELRARIERLERNQAPEREEPKPEAPKTLSGRPKPVLDDFATHEEWVEAVADWKADEKLAQWKADQERERFQTERQTTAQKRQEGFKAKVEGRAEDWERVDTRLLSLMRDNPPVLELEPTDEVGPANFITEAITQSDDPTGFALFLSENEPIVADLFRSSPWELPMKLGKIEARFAKEQAKEEARETRPRTSTAPPPIRPLAPSAQADDDLTKEMDFDSFRKKKNRKA